MTRTYPFATDKIIISQPLCEEHFKQRYMYNEALAWTPKGPTSHLFTYLLWRHNQMARQIVPQLWRHNRMKSKSHMSGLWLIVCQQDLIHAIVNEIPLWGIATLPNCEWKCMKTMYYFVLCWYNMLYIKMLFLVPVAKWKWIRHKLRHKSTKVSTIQIYMMLFVIYIYCVRL